MKNKILCLISVCMLVLSSACGIVQDENSQSRTKGNCNIAKFVFGYKGGSSSSLKNWRTVSYYSYRQCEGARVNKAAAGYQVSNDCSKVCI